MIRTCTSVAIFLATIAIMGVGTSPAQSLETPITRLRPIGAPSAVDQYRQPKRNALYRETAYQPNAFQTGSQVRQAVGDAGSYSGQSVMLQQFDAPTLPGTMQLPGNFSPPPSNLTPNTFPPVTTTPAPMTAPRSLPTSPGNLNAGNLNAGNLVPNNPSPATLNQFNQQIPSSSDLAPVAPPQLNDGFATIDNCNCVTAPSGYMAASGFGGCAPVSYQAPQSYIAPPAAIAAPAILPSGVPVPQGGGVPSGALISFGQEVNPVIVGQGILGQPVAYVPGQTIRNWIRYVFP